MPTIASNAFSLLAIFGLAGHWEVLIVILAILLLFGARKLPEMARGLARGLRTFKDEMKGIKTDVEEPDKDDDKQLSNQSNQSKQLPNSDNANNGANSTSSTNSSQQDQS